MSESTLPMTVAESFSIAPSIVAVTASQHLSAFFDTWSPALVILDENSMATAGDVTAAMCAASKHAVRYYINDYFKLPANAIEVSCDFYGQQVEEQQPEETEQQIDGELDRIAMGDNGAVFSMVGGMSEPTLI